MSNGSINRSVSALRRMFNFARKEGKLRFMPYFPMLRENPPRKGFFEKADYEALFRALPRLRAGSARVGILHRNAEGRGARPSLGQVDFLRNTIRLHAG